MVLDTQTGITYTSQGHIVKGPLSVDTASGRLLETRISRCFDHQNMGGEDGSGLRGGRLGPSLGYFFLGPDADPGEWRQLR